MVFMSLEGSQRLVGLMLLVSYNLLRKPPVFCGLADAEQNAESSRPDTQCKACQINTVSF
jgi:hypothetical protein